MPLLHDVRAAELDCRRCRWALASRLRVSDTTAAARGKGRRSRSHVNAGSCVSPQRERRRRCRCCCRQGIHDAEAEAVASCWERLLPFLLLHLYCLCVLCCSSDDAYGNVHKPSSPLFS
jgi:hypothetical protein